jgi:hypothetical protein
VKEDMPSKPKSPEAKAFKLFSDGKSPVEVAIALDEPGDRVRYMYRFRIEITSKKGFLSIYREW